MSAPRLYQIHRRGGGGDGGGEEISAISEETTATAAAAASPPSGAFFPLAPLSPGQICLDSAGVIREPNYRSVLIYQDSETICKK